MNLFINFNPKYTKSEKILLQKIVRDFLDKKKTIYEIKNLPLSKLKNDTDNYLERFVKKGISFIIEETHGTILPISYYIISKNHIEFFLSPILEDALLEKNDFKVLDLRATLFFEENFTKNFYYMFIINNREKNEFYLTLDQFKESLELNEYERFYDFERNILKKIKSDIDINSNYIIEFEKIKMNDHKNSRVTGLNFKLTDKKSEEKTKLANFLISLVSAKITDYKKLYDIIYNGLNNHHKTELEILIQKASKESKKQKIDVENILEKLLNKKSHYKLLTEFHNTFTNPIELANALSKILKNINMENFLEKEIYSTQFLMKLYFSKDNEELTFQNDGIIVTIKYSRKSTSYIKIYENK